MRGYRVIASYRVSWVRGDLLAGVTVCAYLVPQCMAYAQLAGLPPVTGLWAAILPLGVYAALGTSVPLSCGPETTTALMAVAAVAPLSQGSTPRHAALSAALAVLVGGVCLLGRALRLGFLSDLLSTPILIGYMAGVAVLMICGQLGRLTGMKIGADTPPAQVAEFGRRLGEIHGATLALGLGSLACLILMRRLWPRLPGPLVVVVLSTAVVILSGWDHRGIATVGAIPRGLPPFKLPTVPVADILALLPAALGIALVGYSDNVVTARSFESPEDDHIDANQELLALGVANIGAGVTGGFPVSSSGTRTALNRLAGARSTVANLFTVAVLLVVLLVGRGVMSKFPVAVLGAIVVHAALSLVDIPGFVRLARFRVNEVALALVTMVGVIWLDVLVGIALAVALSVVDLLARVARPHAAVLGRVPGVAGLHDVGDFPVTETTPGLVVFRYDAPVFFANAEDFRRRLLAAVTAEKHQPDWVILNAEAIVDIDTTAAAVIRELCEELERRGIVFALARVKQELLGWLERADLLGNIPPTRIYPTLPTAVEAFESWSDARGIHRGATGEADSGNPATSPGGVIHPVEE